MILLRTLSHTVGVRSTSTARGTLLAGTRLREKCFEGANTAADGLIRGHLFLGLDVVLEAVP